ncbi:unnamed protein product [Ceutorhynchus assimilis]|uniref:Major facilitator superfamily (MFS) profile domain-containing protein n=1 Tax=Ceutorhynchus assimilis TaxID=467358 RepID=A0A9N9QQW6_9CUCU|nr:unnamed protein product [Ceutorhynchus assimilis]
MHFGWASPALPVLTNGTYYFNVSSEGASWMALALFPGMVAGAVTSNCLAHFGRKKLILATSVPLFISWLCMALARTNWLMFWARALGGLGSGLSFATVPMYLGEISEPAIRGLLSSICPLFVVFGILLINILGIYLSIDTTALISCSIPLIGFLSFILMPNSPVQLLFQGRSEEAKQSLRILRGEEEGDKEFVRLSNDMEESMKDQNEGNPTFMDLFNNPVNRKAMLISIGLRSVQQLCGSTALTFYCKTIFQQNEGFLTSDIATIIYFSLQAVLSILASFAVDYFGRRPMFIFSLAGTTLTLFWASTYLAVQTYTSIDLNSYSSILSIALFVNVAFISVGMTEKKLNIHTHIYIHQS